MDREVSLMGKMAYAMLLLAAAISIGFGIFTIVRNSSAEIISVIDEKENIKPSPANYVDYDNTRVTGNDVKSAIYKYSGSDLAFIVGTIKLNDTCDGNWDRDHLTGIYEVYIDNQAAKTNMPYVFVYKSQSASYTGSLTKTTSYQLPKSSGGTTSSAKMMNYGVMYGGAKKENMGVSGTSRYMNGQLYYAPRIYYDNMYSRFYCEANVLTNSQGQVVRNDRYVNINNAGRDEYIPPNGVFESYLLMSPNEEVIGLVFIQVLK